MELIAETMENVVELTERANVQTGILAPCASMIPAIQPPQSSCYVEHTVLAMLKAVRQSVRAQAISMGTGANTMRAFWLIVGSMDTALSTKERVKASASAQTDGAAPTATNHL